MAPDIHENLMKQALDLAKQGLGRTAENPTVGCVIVKDGEILGQARTADGGRPHAEPQALEQAGANAKGATAYVTLEPCAHFGETPPCAQALIDAEIKHVVVACGDPDERVSGKGIEMLKEAGIEVTENILEQEARAVNAGFFSRIQKERPYITLKIATSADHKIAANDGARTQITGGEAVQHTHLLRSQNDGILVGANTARVDQPKLTVRLNGEEYSNQRFILGNAHLEGFITIEDHDVEKAVKYLATEQKINRLMVEGGAIIHSAFLETGLVDEFHWLKSSKELGPQGVEALKNHDISSLEAGFGLKKQETRALGEDLLEIYTR